MDRLKMSVRSLIKNWLGLTEELGRIRTELNLLRRSIKDMAKWISPTVGIDWSPKENTVIVVLSKLHGGRCEIIESRVADPTQLRKMIAEIRQFYEIPHERFIYDGPQRFQEMMRQMDEDENL